MTPSNKVESSASVTVDLGQYRKMETQLENAKSRIAQLESQLAQAQKQLQESQEVRSPSRPVVPVKWAK